MKILMQAAFAALTLTASSLWAADPGVTFIGRGTIPGSASDKSGLMGQICQKGNPANCIAKTTFGGFGSGLTYTGYDNVFLATPDRGPFDGQTDVPYIDRFHFLHITVDTNVSPISGSFNIATTLLDTRLLKNKANQNFVGDSTAFNEVNPLATLRFDPEGVAVSRQGTFFVSEEYGPYINEFNRQGHLIRRIPVPAKFLIANPSGEVNPNGDSVELFQSYNTSGRQANRGMEGLAITPDGRYLVGIMQNALIQDNGLTYPLEPSTPSRVGLNNRILKLDLLTGQTQEFVYTLDAISQGKGVSEILAINAHELLVLERDNRSLVTPGADPFSTSGANCCGLKKIYKIDLDEATDVSNVPSLPQSGAELAEDNISPVTKTLFLDLLDPSYIVDTNGNTIKKVIAEKIEGLAWGPDLEDGRHVLYVTSDNDLNTSFPTQIYAFAIEDTDAGITYQPQVLPAPLYPPGQVKKALSNE